MKPEEILETWEGYLKLISRAKAFLTENEYFKFLVVQKDYIEVYYEILCEGEFINACYLIPVDYFCRDDDAAVKEFLEMKKQLEIKAEWNDKIVKI